MDFLSRVNHTALALAPYASCAPYGYATQCSLPAGCQPFRVGVIYPLGIDYMFRFLSLFPHVLVSWRDLPTILHEIGHLVHRDRCAPARRIELACDAFAIDFLAHCNRPNAIDGLILGLAVWMCCMCAESLRYDEFTSTSHPSPAQRMERLFARRLPRTHSRNMKAFRLLCFGQLVNFAKIRREDLVEQINNRDYGSIVARIHALRKCWGPLA